MIQIQKGVFPQMAKKYNLALNPPKKKTELTKDSMLAFMKDRGNIYGSVQPGSPAEYGSCCCHRRVAQSHGIATFWTSVIIGSNLICKYCFSAFVTFT